MRRASSILVVSLAMLFLSSSQPSSPSDVVLQRELQSLADRGLGVKIFNGVVEATDPGSGRKWHFPMESLKPREPVPGRLPTLTVDLRILDTNQFDWKYHYLSTVPISSEWGFAIPTADVDRDGRPEAYGTYQTPGNDIHTRIYEYSDSANWTLVYTYPTEGGWVEHIADLDADGKLEAFVRLGDSLYVYEQGDSFSLPINEWFRYPEWYGGNARGIPGVLHDMDGDGKRDLVYRGSEPPNSDEKVYIAGYDDALGNLRIGWSAPLPPGCYGEYCAGAIACGDFDRDGLEEFVTSTFYGKVFVVERTVDDSFAVAWTESLSVAGRVAAGDVDGNGNEEFFVGGTQVEDDGYVHLRMYAFERIGNNAYQPVFAFNIFPAGIFFVDLYQTRDIDGDGQPELLLSFAGGVLVLKGTAPYQYEVFYYRRVSLLLGMATGHMGTDRFPELLISRQSESGGWTEVFRLDSLFTGVQSGPTHVREDAISLQCFPNPFNSTTTIRFGISERAWVGISIFDIAGREVAMVVHREYPAGQHSVVWETNSLEGGDVRPSGVYFCRMQVDDKSAVMTIVHLK
jgi:hypothetical protein